MMKLRYGSPCSLIFYYFIPNDQNAYQNNMALCILTWVGGNIDWLYAIKLVSVHTTHLDRFSPWCSVPNFVFQVGREKKLYLSSDQPDRNTYWQISFLGNLCKVLINMRKKTKRYYLGERWHRNKYINFKNGLCLPQIEIQWRKKRRAHFTDKCSGWEA